MNFLAHFYLSENKETVLLGNFLGDFVKGNPHKVYPKPLARAIQLHRQIDSFTDAHPKVRESIALLRPVCGKYAGVAADMLYDHLLAKHWNAFHTLPLSNFSEKTYSILHSHYTTFPQKAQRTLYYMVKYNWLESYATLEGIQTALINLEHRILHRAPLGKASKVLMQYPEQFKNQFFAFFPEVEQFTQKYIRENIG